MPLPPLPIDQVLDNLTAILSARSAAVLVAPPGAGKTTRVPLALLEAEWLGGKKILVLEPRRLAARGAASHMASLLGQQVGETIGLRARLGTMVGRSTRVEVITEGVFTRMILDDPELAGVGAVLFDEFHERSLDADLGLALALDAQSGLREDLRLVVMSATIDGARVASLIGDAPIISCEGRSFPVETRYLGRQMSGAPGERIEDQAAAAVLKALLDEQGSILVFLPGQAEIRRVAERLAERVRDPVVDVAPLYAGLDASEQDRAIEPARAGRRKVVLATSIAETSLTIEGVRVVIDCGVARVPRFEPGSGLTRLETVRVTKASADQRRGRAGRLQPGVCYRLWAEPETQSLLPYAEPEIRNADLARLLIDCAAWGVGDPTTLRWLDGPPGAALAVARGELEAIGAVGADRRLTELGRRMSRLPLPPRVSAMLLLAAETGEEAQAAEIAALLVERGLGGTDTDLAARQSRFRSDRGPRAQEMRRLARQWAMDARQTAQPVHQTRTAKTPVRPFVNSSPAALLALAFPDRIAKARGHGAQYLMANGRAARLEEHDPLARARYLVVAESSGSAAAGRIRLAAALEDAALEAMAKNRVIECQTTAFDSSTASVRTTSERRLGAITLASTTRPAVPGEEVSAILCQGLAARGIDQLPWSRMQRQLRERVGFIRTLMPGNAGMPDQWPDLSDRLLASSITTWLGPFLAGKTAVEQICADDLGHALGLLIPHRLRDKLDQEAPTHFVAPTGNRHPIDYADDAAAIVSIRVQELFGISTHPAIAGGRLAITFELLSPAHRPIQVTSDLPGFWRGSWRDVRAEMRGRYPKHEWPENPALAKPTARAKPRH